MGVTDSLNTLLSDIHYCTKFRRCMSSHFGVGMGSKNLGTQPPPPLDVGVADPLEIRFCPTCVITPNSVILGQTIYERMKIYQKNVDPSRAAFQGHSKSLEPTRIDRLPMTSY